MTSVRRRPAPLRVDPAERGPVDAGVEVADVGDDTTGRARTDEDRRSFAAAVRALRTGTGALNLSERTLMVAGGVLAPLGVLFVLLGWIGASRTPNLFEQIPYLISGGLLGLALVFLGSFFYFAHWITELVKEGRAQSAALLDAVESLRQEVAAGTAPTVTSSPIGVTPPLVATLRGSMAHRHDCIVVADKQDLRAVTDLDALMPCKLCDPHEAN